MASWRVGVVDAQHRAAVERQVMQEADERLLQSRKVVLIGLHVIGVDVCHHGNDRLQMEKRGIGFIGLDDDELAFSETRIRCRGVEAPPDHVGRIEARFGQHAGDQAGCGGLAMCTRHGDALLQAHQFGQHQCTRHDRNATIARGKHLGIIGTDRRRHHDRIRCRHIGGVMSDRDAHAQAGKALGGGVGAQIRPGHFVTQVQQHLGYAGHAGAANADEMDAFDFMLHANAFSPALPQRRPARQRMLLRSIETTK